MKLEPTHTRTCFTYISFAFCLLLWLILRGMQNSLQDFLTSKSVSSLSVNFSESCCMYSSRFERFNPCLSRRTNMSKLQQSNSFRRMAVNTGLTMLHPGGGMSWQLTCSWALYCPSPCTPAFYPSTLHLGDLCVTLAGINQNFVSVRLICCRRRGEANNRMLAKPP